MKITVPGVMVLILFYSGQIAALERLFMTPEQRIRLQAKNTNSVTDDQPTYVAPTHLLLNGFVKPKNRSSTVWLNGSAQHAKRDKNYFVREGITQGNKITVEVQGGKAHLQPGQRIDLQSRRIFDVYSVTTPKTVQENTAEEDTSDDEQQNSPTALVAENLKKISRDMSVVDELEH